jgi:hypothetical protein
MSANGIEKPFESIESAYEFMNVLAQTVLETVKELHGDYQIALRDGQNRRARAIELALFKTKMLGCYVHKCRRNLNDLRTIRRLILNERVPPKAVLASVQNE